MGVLAAILAAGLLLTANPKWLLLSDDAKATPAICIVGCYMKPGPNMTWVHSHVPIPAVKPWQPAEWFWTPIISAGVVVLAFVSRVVRLHKSLSVGVSRATKWFDGQTQQLLWVLFRILGTERDIYSLKRSLVYRPVLGIVMVLRFVLDSWASFAVEVCSVFERYSSCLFLIHTR